MLSLLVGMRRSAAAAAPTLSVIGQRLIDAANHLIRPVSMETRSGADVQEDVGLGGGVFVHLLHQLFKLYRRTVFILVQRNSLKVQCAAFSSCCS